MAWKTKPSSLTPASARHLQDAAGMSIEHVIRALDSLREIVVEIAGRPRTAADFAETLPSKPGKRSLNLSHQNRRLRGGDRRGATERMDVE